MVLVWLDIIRYIHISKVNMEVWGKESHFPQMHRRKHNKMSSRFKIVFVQLSYFSERKKHFADFPLCDIFSIITAL